MRADIILIGPPVGFDQTPFVKHPSNQRLARHVVYTKDETAEQTRDRVIAVLGLDSEEQMV